MEIATELGYYKRQPVILVKPAVERNIPVIGQKTVKPRFLVSMGQLHEWSEDHNATFEQHLMRIGYQIYALFDLGVPTSRKLADIAHAIQSRIDDLLKMPPLDPVYKQVGEATITAAGETFKQGIKDEVNGDGYKQYSN
jgi:hypothetical protein